MATVLLQVRMGSTRLPGKALMPILKRPMLFYTVETLKIAPMVDRIVLATTFKGEDNPLVEFARKSGIDHFRGSDLNVLERFYKASLLFKDNYYFRATGDNPILDYNNPHRILNYLIDNNCDYAAERGMPLGSTVEVFTFEAIEKCYKKAKTDDNKEHVTLYMYSQEKNKSSCFNVKYIDAPHPYYHPKLRLTVDYLDDFNRTSLIIENLYKEKIPPFKEIIDFVKKQGWI